MKFSQMHQHFSVCVHVWCDLLSTKTDGKHTWLGDVLLKGDLNVMLISHSNRGCKDTLIHII